MSTNIAQAYVQLQRAYLLHDVAVTMLAERERIHALTRDRNAAGLDSRLELKQAESALPATREESQTLVPGLLAGIVDLAKAEACLFVGQPSAAERGSEYHPSPSPAMPADR